MFNLFMNDCMFFYSPDGGGSGTDTDKEDKENKDNENEDKNDEKITLTKKEYEERLKQKYAEGARKATKNTSKNEEDTTNDKEETKDNKQDNSTNDEIKSIKDELAELRGEKIALNLGVNPSYTEDIVAICKGRGLELNETNMKSILEKHQGWKASNDEEGGTKPLGSTKGKTTPPAASEEEQASKLFNN